MTVTSAQAESFPAVVRARLARPHSLLRFASVTAQLGFVLLLLKAFEIEEGYGLTRLLPLLFVAFLVHAALPLRWRIPFFVLISWAAFCRVLGFPHGPGLIVLSLVLIATCHLPVPFAARVALVVAGGAGLAVLRAEWIKTPWLSLADFVLPLLASMFMFRLAVYLYDLRRGALPESFWQRLAYFFMLPNACFLLFPVIDLQTFRRTWYNGDAYEIYQKGVLWILRGLTHLLLYRLVDHFILVSASDVQDLSGVVRFVVGSYLLYLRISGHFHLIAGILCLFGYNLPETHHLYYFASSFTDFWRRINIYWKDFMMKLFYYPAFVQLRRFGLAAGVVLATLVVFLATWLLHSYQWFWLRGSFPLTTQDGAFWGALGILVVVNALTELRSGRAPRLRSREWSRRAAWTRSARTVGMFVVMSLLWSLWSSGSIAEWLVAMEAVTRGGAGQVAALLVLIASAVTVGVGIQDAARRRWLPNVGGDRPGFGAATIYTAVVGGLLTVVALAPAREQPTDSFSGVLAAVQQDRLSARARAALERGYYEGLLGTDRYVSAFGALQRTPEGWIGLGDTEAVRRRQDLLWHELVPNYRGTYKGAALNTNSWGMRDDPVSLEKPPATVRIALLGASYEMGDAVSHEQTFGTLLERRLNAERPLPGIERYEVLNFAVAGYSVIQSALLLESRVPAFDPDLILVAVHTAEKRRTVESVLRPLSRGFEVQNPELRQIFERADVMDSEDAVRIRARLTPRVGILIRWSVNHIALLARRNHVSTALLYVPTTDAAERSNSEVPQLLQEVTRGSGLAVLSLEHAYGDAPRAEISLNARDDHPNAAGHRLLADALYPLVVAQLRGLR